MYRLIYLSEARRRMSPEEIDAIVGKSRRKNDKCHVAALLIPMGGRFLQVLEGDAAQVTARFHRIAADPRHGEIRVVCEGPSAEAPLCATPMDWRARADLTASQAGALAEAFELADLLGDVTYCPRPRHKARRLREVLPVFACPHLA